MVALKDLRKTGFLGACMVLCAVALFAGCKAAPPGGGPPAECDPADCPDDGNFCTGTPVCDADDNCALSGDPCGAGETCDEANDVCIECEEDADCANDDWCDGDETCGADGQCADGTAPCAAGETCNEDTDTCEPAAQPNADLETDANAGVDFDNLIIGETYELVAPPAAVPAQPAAGCTCAWTVDGAGTFDPADECTTDYTAGAGDTLITVVETCNGEETTFEQDVSVSAPAGFAVTMSGCPDDSSGGSFDLTASATGGTGDDVSYGWAATGAASVSPGNGATTTVTVSGAGNVTITVTARDLDFGSNGVADIGSNGEVEGDDTALDSDTADCAFTGSFTAELQVEAGTVNPGRSTAASFVSGAPGTAGNNALNGSANQQGVDPDAIFVEWAVVSQPGGSGAVSFSNENETETAYTIAPPASAGAYTFSLTATNENTGEENDDTATLELLAVPTVVVQEDFVPTRIHELRGSTSRDVVLTYTSGSDGSITIYDGTANSDTLDPVVTVPITDNNGVASDVTASIPATGDRETLSPRAYALASQITDSVGVTPGDTDVDGLFSDNAAALADATNAEANERPLFLYTSVPWTEPATPAGGGLPPTIAVNTEVGEVNGAGTGVNQVAHSGIGAGAPALTQVTANSVVTGVDFDGDGYDDYAVLRTAAWVDVFFGRPGMNTDYAAAGAGADDWPLQPPANNRRGEAVAVANAISIAAGDVNGDTYPDLVVVEGSGGADQVRVILGQGPTTVTPFVNAAVAGRFRLYPGTTVATDFNVGTAVVADVTGDGTGDIVVGAPNYLVPGGAAGDGAIFVIYGSGGLAASGTNIETVAAAPTGRTIPGTAAGALRRGEVVGAGDFDASGGMDVVAAYGNLVASGIEVFVGSSVFPGAPTVVYNLAAAGDMVGGELALADVDGAAGTDIVVGAAAANAGTGRFSIIPNGTAANQALNGATTLDYTGGAANALGSGIGVGLYNDDATLDVLIGAPGGLYFDVVYGPITGDFAIGGVDLRLANPGALGDQALFGDVNADGNEDLIVTDSAGNLAYCLFGLD